MYAGAVSVPSHHRARFEAQPEEVAVSISADLFACGLATSVQSIVFPGVGIRPAGDDGRLRSPRWGRFFHGGIARCRIAWNFGSVYFGWRFALPGLLLYEADSCLYSPQS